MKKLAVAFAAGLGFMGMAHAAGYGVIDMQRVVENSTYLKQQKLSVLFIIKSILQMKQI